ncbi:MAG: Hsp20/alpha crystallin family protein [Lewinellaceae bacterium]|nr:Hsp20/alpha crystallin family protein [Saprospiraceae bacterium]MCB9340329.1 Hsp20/alpha crystallin family protein [Lewinellaceae bacterium]
MKITNWTGLSPRQTYSRSLDDFFNDRYRSLLGMTDDFTPAINTKEEKESYGIEVAAPGYDKKDLKVAVNDGLLTISTNKRLEEEYNHNGYLRREFSYSSFIRSFTLPKDVDDKHISAEYKNGILHINLPRQAKAATNEAERKITIQ